jgi:hypothetical protein
MTKYNLYFDTRYLTIHLMAITYIILYTIIVTAKK